QDEVLVDHEDSQRGALADAGRLCLAFTRRTMTYIPAGPLRTGIFPITERGGPHWGRVRRLLLRRFDRGRFEPGWRYLLFCLRTKEIPQRRVKHVDRVADLHERHRPVEPALYGLDFGVVTIDGDEVEVALGLAFNHQKLIGPE